MANSSSSDGDVVWSARGDKQDSTPDDRAEAGRTSVTKASTAAGVRASACPPPWDVENDLREHFRRIQSAVHLPAGESCALGVCSLAAGEGVSWITAKLACAFAEDGESTLIVDADRTQPAQLEFFGAKSAPAVALAGAGSQRLLSRSTLWSHLSIVSLDDREASSGSGAPKSPASSGSSGGLGATVGGALLPESITALRSRARYTLVDCEALRDSSQVLHLGPALDGVFFVVEAERERREPIANAIETLKRSRIPILGLILNKRRVYIPGFIYRRI